MLNRSRLLFSCGGRRVSQSSFPGRVFRANSAHGFAFAFLTLLASIAWLSTAPRASAQGQITGNVVGTVTDQSGALIPGAAVTLSAPDRGFSRTVKANGHGEYTFNLIPIGTYSLRATAKGFSSFTASNVVVDANVTVRVTAALPPANVSASVTVEGTGTTIDTSSSTIGELIDNKLVQNLPIDGGNVVTLAGLLPGVVNVNAPTTFTGDRSGPTFGVSGSRSTQNLMLLDGSMWNNLFYNTGLNYPPRQALAEVSVLLNDFKAQYGRNAGSIFNVLTDSGTDAVHGQLWEYYENNDTSAADGVIDRPDAQGFVTPYYASNPHLNSNQFGATIGGPIVKDKLFFFAAFQNIRDSEEMAGQVFLQTYAERGLSPNLTPLPCTSASAFYGQDCANFSADAPTGKTNSYLKNPLWTGNTYSGVAKTAINTAYTVAGGVGQSPCVTELEPLSSNEYLPDSEMPSVCFNPVMLNTYNKYLPLPSTTNSTYPNIPTWLIAPYPRSEYDGLFRVDYNTGKHSINARYYTSDTGDRAGQGVSSSEQVGLPGYERMDDSGLNRFANIADTWILSPTLVNNATLAYKRYQYEQVPTDPTTLSTLGSQVQAFGMPTLPVFDLDLYDMGNTSQGYSHTVNEDIEFDDALTWTHGNHNMQFGVSWLRLQYLNVTQDPGEIGYSTTYTADVFADALLGLPNSLQVGNTENQAGIQHEVFAYAQDDWRATPRLTLNLGVRYELPFAWYQPDREDETFIRGYQSQRFPQAPADLAYVGDRGVPRGLINDDFDGIAPRLGFSYDVFGNGRTVMRGGYGLFFDAVNANVIGVGEPFYDRFNYAVPVGGTSEPLLDLASFPLRYDKSDPQFPSPASIYFPDKNFKTPYVMGFNYGFIQRLTRSSTLEVDYVGRLARHLTMPIDLNPAIYDCSGAYFQANPSLYCTGASELNYQQRVQYAGFGYGGQGIVDFDSMATSNYNGLQVMYNQRATSKLTIIANYTYSRSLDMDTNGEEDNNEVPDVFNPKTEYGPSDYNVKHNVNGGFVYYFPKLARGHLWERAILNGWQTNGIFQFRTGLPFNLTINDDAALTDEPRQRPVLLPGQNPYLSNHRSITARKQEYFNVNAFGYPEPGTYSTFTRNKMVGPGYGNVNLTLGRTFPLAFRPGTDLTFRVDGFNALNMSNLANPNGEFACSSSTPMVPCTNPKASSFFGQILTSTGPNGRLTDNGRRLQFSLVLRY